MILKILKDSLVLFFLIYGFLHCIYSFFKWLCHKLSIGKEPQSAIFFDFRKAPSEGLEYLFHNPPKRRNETIYIIVDTLCPEETSLLRILCKKYENLYPVTGEELCTLFTKKDEDIFSGEESSGGLR